MSNYKDIWEKGEGSKFWNTVDFNHPFYKKQEQVFRGFLHGFKYIMGYGIHKGKVESVLELGAGTGRMTKIMLQVFPDIKRYDIVDLDIKEKIDPRIDRYGPMDITSKEFVNWFHPDHHNRNYDFILASEVFMHIRPEDIERVMKLVCKLAISTGSGTVLNIDWTSAPEHSTWCYIHDYDKLYRENGLKYIFTANIPDIKQKLFCYGA